MIVKDKACLRSFAEKTVCERCGKRVFTGLDPHHVFGRGFGGGKRLDIPLALCAICRTCHDLYHNGKIPKSEFVAIIARRERMTPEAVEAEINRILRLPKGSRL